MKQLESNYKIDDFSYKIKLMLAKSKVLKILYYKKVKNIFKKCNKEKYDVIISFEPIKL